MTPAQPALPPEGRAALRGGVVGNWVDNIHVFLPLVALAPAMTTLVGDASATTGALVVIAMLLGRPVGGLVFGRISDRLGRTRTTKVAIAGTALCALAIALLPTHLAIGAAALALLLTLRFIGGVFVAGEYSAAIPLAMEWAAPRRRGLFSGLILSMAPWAQASIAFATAALLALLGPSAYAAWGWRALFVAGAAASLGMLLYYRRHVTDAPVFHRRQPGTRARVPLAALLAGRHASAFWQVFALMSGLWLWTAVTVLILPSRLAGDVGLPASGVAIAMGVASVAQAVVMSVTGHLSTLMGRRRFFIIWGTAACLTTPLLWFAIVGSTSLGGAAALAAMLQVVTVSGYGPVSAYLSERFPTEVRSTGYGLGYSWSLVLPALYPFYLPGLERWLGHQGAILGMLVLGGLLIAGAAAVGPRLASEDVGGLDEAGRAQGRASRA